MNPISLLAPATSLAAAVVWLFAFRAALPALRGGQPMSLEARLAPWAAVLGVAILLAMSSLGAVDIIPADWSRFLLLVARSALLVTGLVAWLDLREHRG